MHSDPVWSRTCATFDLHSSWLRPRHDTSELSSHTASFAQEREAKRVARPPLVLAQDMAAGLTLSKLQAALVNVLERHSALRTSFHYEVMGKDERRRLVSIIKPVEQIDTSSLIQVVDAEGTTINSVIIQQQALRFDKEKAPLLRIALVLGKPRVTIVIAVDRLIADIHSLYVIARDLSKVPCALGIWHNGHTAE